MKFPWYKYKELPLSCRNTLQVFITSECNLFCRGCFARNAMQINPPFMSFDEYELAVTNGMELGAKQINILGGEPTLHPELERFLAFNALMNLKTTVYTNGKRLSSSINLHGAKLRVSIYGVGGPKGAKWLPGNLKCKHSFDANFMVSKDTTLAKMMEVAEICENDYKCKVFFIFSMRELDNPRQEFFDDTPLTMPVIEYKELVHQFLTEYEGNMDIHISKRGVFESSTTLPHTTCRFANYLIGGRIVQCPYDLINMKTQPKYEFGKRPCQHNNTCLMSKIILRPKRRKR